MSVGITLSAPAILSQHEYIESLLEKENMRKKTEQRASSANRTRRRENLAARFPSLERKDKSIDSISRKTISSTTSSQSTTKVIPLNLPEFENFQSDHLVLAAHLLGNSHHDRSRCSSAMSISTKLHRTSTNHANNVNQPSSPKMVTNSIGSNNSHSPRSNYATSKRLSRSRQAHDTTINHASFSSSSSQQAQAQTQIVRPISLRQMTTKFDAIGCFREVRKDF